jgi:CrcB protein
VTRDLLAVFVAGGAGSTARYLVGLGAARAFGTSFPIGTLIVNVVGSFAMGVVVSLAARGLPEAWRLTLAVGFLGGFTTYSSFNQELLNQVRDASVRQASVYLMATLVLCIVSGVLGDRLVRAFV